jgi:hypothetical protein
MFQKCENRSSFLMDWVPTCPVKNNFKDRPSLLQGVSHIKNIIYLGINISSPVTQGVPKVLEVFVFEISLKSLGALKNITARLKLRF